MYPPLPGEAPIHCLREKSGVARQPALGLHEVEEEHAGELQQGERVSLGRPVAVRGDRPPAGPAWFGTHGRTGDLPPRRRARRQRAPRIRLDRRWPPEASRSSAATAERSGESRSSVRRVTPSNATTSVRRLACEIQTHHPDQPSPCRHAAGHAVRSPVGTRAGHGVPCKVGGAAHDDGGLGPARNRIPQRLASEGGGQRGQILQRAKSREAAPPGARQAPGAVRATLALRLAPC